MKASLVLLILILISHKANTTVKNEKHEIFSQYLIYSQIIKNSPKIQKNYAAKLSNVIFKVTNEMGINPKKYAAILAQESMYRLNAKNCKNNKCHDYGIAQINKKTIKHFNFDEQKLLTDLEYSIKAGAIVLANFKKLYGHKEKDFWTRYNASNPLKRKRYKELVIRYL